MKQTIGYKYLDFIALTNFDLWDVKRYNNFSNLKFDNDIMLSEILTPYKKLVSKEEMIENKWQIISKINFGGELFLRDFEEINTYKGKLYLVPENAIIYSKINVRHGCIYYNDKDNTSFGVSSEYPIFTFDENKVNGYFLKKVLRSSEFKKLLNTKTSGISKARVKQDEFLNIKIPLPSLSEQEAIVKAYQTKIEQAQNLEQQAQDLEQEIEKYFLNELGIKNVEKRIKTVSLNIIEFNNIEKWGVEFNLGSNNDSFLSSQIFKNEKLKNLVEINPRTDLLENDKNISFIPMECVSDDFGEIIELKSKKISESKGYTKFQENDLIWARITPCMQNGKSAIVSNLENKLGCGSTEFHVIRNNNTSNTHTEYIYHILRLKIVLNRATSYFTGSAGQQRVPKSFLEELVIPVPPIDVQVKISNKLSEIKTNIKTNITQAKNLKHQAEQEFEQAIFS
ncbi:restriction endonuclease subunit S [Riemerella anatipestifer]|uniref:Type I restriction modification DNA specificity domain-containing protein n=1 Tax=Riemerella anatipestifer RA-CH-1 TaxID=1228997 RepID=J9R8F6_RIEAN|nr:restriction endonuclease subunit S [Riemerella anatipestifer]AFR36017.1 hypothetical protein B739_1419 [Riemerella anatipestifer RA-CH-1]MCO7331159.1 restriction endonuclease subunit S [Riemerella anatipestifer]MCO7349791.1 restriction endonuclease subunit S [Riemerella anatipestifer]MCU7542396.1 restriction endonuclease subunit S [Riemerella anatipestifer]MCU7583133.1 restriction endonuclease subunit S [Riemerella anatipestifer]